MEQERLKELSSTFYKMSLENQLHLIELMAGNLDNCFPESSEEKQLKLAKKLLKNISGRLEEARKDASLAETMALLDTLSVSQLVKLLNSFSNNVHRFAAKNRQKAAEDKCRKDGHIFGQWEVKKYKTYISPAQAHGIEGLLNGGKRPTIPVEHTQWHRTCERCGFIEKTEQKPQELVDAEAMENKSKEIQRLRRRLKKLESGN